MHITPHTAKDMFGRKSPKRIEKEMASCLPTTVITLSIPLPARPWISSRWKPQPTLGHRYILKQLPTFPKRRPFTTHTTLYTQHFSTLKQAIMPASCRFPSFFRGSYPCGTGITLPSDEQIADVLGKIREYSADVVRHEGQREHLSRKELFPMTENLFPPSQTMRRLFLFSVNAVFLRMKA